MANDGALSFSLALFIFSLSRLRTRAGALHVHLLRREKNLITLIQIVLPAGSARPRLSIAASFAQTIVVSFMKNRARARALR